MIDIDLLSEEELDELEDKLRMRKTFKEYNKNIEKIIENRKYLGKCYKEKDSEKYLMIISPKSSNDYRLEALCFHFPIKFSEKHRLTKMFRADCAFGGVSFEPFYVEDYPLLCNDLLRHGKVINNLEEISKDEYFKKMNEYVEELQLKLSENFFDTSKNIKKLEQR